MQAQAVEGGKKAMNIGSNVQINFWVVQYKLTEQYIQQAKEMIGQLDIARYSSQMQTTVKEFFNCMAGLGKQLTKFFGYSSLDQIERIFDKNQMKIEIAKDKTNEIIEETTDRFKEMQDRLADSSLEMNISEEERTKIIGVFEKAKKPNNNSLFTDIFN